MWRVSVKVLLIRPYWFLPQEMLSPPTEPLGLEYIASFVQQHHEVAIFDAVVGEEYPFHLMDTSTLPRFADKFGVEYIHYGVGLEVVRKKIETYKPDVVGISGEFFFQEEPFRQICCAVKEVNPNITVIAGGAFPSSYPEGILREDKNVDMVVIGEGEQTVKELLDQGLRDLDTINGIAYRGENGRIVKTHPRVPIEDLDSIPFPARELVPFRSYSIVRRPLFARNSSRFFFVRKSKLLSEFVNMPPMDRLHDFVMNRTFVPNGFNLPIGGIITSRGCPCSCNFCCVHNVWGRGIRTRSAESVLEEIQLLKRDYGVRQIYVYDDNFTVPKKRAIDICKGLADLDLTWFAISGLYIPSLDRELLTWIKRSGCDHVMLAVESGNQRILNEVIGKGLKLNKVREIITTCRDLGLTTEGFFLIGLPGETKTNMIETIRFAATSGLDRARLYVATPFPGSRLYDECIRDNLLVGDFDLSRLQVTLANLGLRPAMIETEEFSAEDVLRLVKIGLKALEERDFDKYKAELEAI